LNSYIQNALSPYFRPTQNFFWFQK
jgi:hypothetical protein